MKKSTLKVAAIIMCLATCLTAFAACKKVDENALIYEKNGKIYYRPNEKEAAYELATDDKGNTRVDGNGNLLYKVTNAAGEDQTHPVSYPEFLEDGKKISCQQFSIKMPKGYVNTANQGQNIMLENTKKGVQINYSFYDNDEEKTYAAADRVKEALELFNKGIEAGEITAQTSDSEIAGRPAKKVVFEFSEQYMEVYYIDAKGGVMSFTCYCSLEQGGKYDFKSILDTIEYRV